MKYLIKLALVNLPKIIFKITQSINQGLVFTYKLVYIKNEYAGGRKDEI